MNYIRKTDRLDIIIEESRRIILIQQKWKYDWLNAPGTTPWTHQHKKDFHHKLDGLIWSGWGSHVTLEATGTSDFVKRNNGMKFKLEFDVKWVLTGGHWQVNVTKIPKGSFDRSHVIWSTRVIKLDTEDVNRRKIDEGYYQYPVVHEFGHAVGNFPGIYAGAHGDEYVPTSPHIADNHSLLNMGSELRDRHMDYVLREINAMVPSTTFTIHKIR
jgi:hypothetical protein